MGGIGSTPSFPGLNNLADWRDRFRTFYARPPHIAYIRVEGIAQPKVLPDYAAKVTLTLDDAEDVFAFVETIPARYRTRAGRDTRLATAPTEEPAARFFGPIIGPSIGN